MKYLTGAASTLRSATASPLILYLMDGTPPTIEEIEATIVPNSTDPTMTNIVALKDLGFANQIVFLKRNTNINPVGMVSPSNPIVIDTTLNLTDSNVTHTFRKEGTPTWFFLATISGSDLTKCYNVMYGYIPDHMKVEPSLIKQDSVIYISLLAMED